MEILIKTKYTIRYQVESFEGTEGGMDHHTYGKAVGTIEEAILLLELANVGDMSSNSDWIITCEVTKEINNDKHN